MSSLSAPAGPEAILSTGAAARICGVDRRTISRWVDDGIVRSHRTPGGRRRVLRRDLLAFMRARDMPVVEPVETPRLAIVDDEPEVRRALKRSAKRIMPNAQIASAQDGFTAGALIITFRPHLVFLDVVMPGISGVDVCRFVRSLPELAGMAVVVVSGSVDASTRQALESAGVTRILEKPFTDEQIASALRDFLDPSLDIARADATFDRPAG